MNRIDRYIASSVLWAFLIIVIILLGLDFTFTFIDQVKKVNDNYTISSLLQVILYRLPGKFTEFVPVSALIGTLMGFGTLAATSELTVMRAAGMPIWRIGISACQPILLVALIGTGISEFVAPAAEQKADLIEKLNKQQNNDFSLTGGTWLKAEKKFIYIDAADKKDTLYGIQIYSPSGQKLEDITTATTAQHINGNIWQLNNVTNTSFLNESVSVEKVDNQEWRTSIKPEHLFLASQDPDSLSPSQLLSYKGYLEQQGLDSAQHELSFWIIALRPAAALALVIVALSSVFGPLRSSTMGGRIFSGVLIGLMFQNVLNLFGRMSVVIDFPPVIGVGTPILFCFIAGILLMRRRG